MNHFKYCAVWICALITLMSMSDARSAELGDPAAKLNIETWVKGEAVTLEQGAGKNIYVVEFWATWCGPCRTSIPHLTELQAKYKDDNVVFIGVSDEPVKTVEPFVSKMGKEMDYRVAVDTTRKTHKGYMTAYNQRGIPTAFVVDKEGQIAWVGHPMDDLDRVLSKVIDGTYDIKLAQQAKIAKENISKYFELIDSGDLSEAKVIGEKILQGLGDDIQLLNDIAWFIITEPKLKHRDLDLALKMSRAAYDASEGKDVAIIDTYARAYYEIGDVENAITYQQKAVDMADDEDMREELKEILAMYKKSAQTSTSSAEPPDGFTALFNGNNLEGWYGHNPHDTANKIPADKLEAAIAGYQAAFNEHWSVDKGELVNDGQGPYSTTKDEYGDIELHIEYKTVALADSGIYLRGAPQVQIWDTTEAGGKWKYDADKGSGALWNNTPDTPGRLPSVYADKPFGEWNSLRILQLGSRTTIEFNDQLVVDNAIMENYWDPNRVKPLPARGPIHLQTHGGEIRWRNIYLREVSAEEANKRLRGDDKADGFTSLYNGKDLTGWQGDTDDYEVREGAIVCKKGQGGNLFTEEEYSDFVVRLEFKLPPGGNNGLAIRYPGKGNPAYDGMTELQVLDDTAKKYDDLDPRQYHGSVYGQVASQRGYLRPLGEWNYQEVTVKGSTIKVELNGSVIINTDINTVTDFKGDPKAYVGRSLTKGYFGFAGHDDPVMYRNIAIKRLE